MSRKPKRARARRKKTRSQRSRLPLWGAVLALGLAVALLGGHLYRQMPVPTVPTVTVSAARDAVEDLLGVLSGDAVRLRVADVREARQVLARLRGVAERFRAEVDLGAWGETAHSLGGSLTVDGQITAVRVEWPPATPNPAEQRLLALVIDDMGHNPALDRAFLELPVPITPSVLPYLPHSREVCELARERGREWLLHLPMEPQGYPRHDPGRGAILASMAEAEVRAQVRAALAAVPGAVGANNHMGSRLTELPDAMGWVLEELGREGLFFVDSVTSARTVAAELAREKGMPWGRRDVFLDHERTPEAVGRQMAKAIELARSRGAALAIGHPHSVTLETLRSYLPKLDAAGVTVVPVRRVLQVAEGV